MLKNLKSQQIGEDFPIKNPYWLNLRLALYETLWSRFLVGGLILGLSNVFSKCSLFLLLFGRFGYCNNSSLEHTVSVCIVRRVSH